MVRTLTFYEVIWVQSHRERSFLFNIMVHIKKSKFRNFFKKLKIIGTVVSVGGCNKTRDTSRKRKKQLFAFKEIWLLAFLYTIFFFSIYDAIEFKYLVHKWPSTLYDFNTLMNLMATADYLYDSSIREKLSLLNETLDNARLKKFTKLHELCGLEESREARLGAWSLIKIGICIIIFISMTNND